jgi:hypothetical protein
VQGPAPFHALPAFAAGGVFITTGSDEPGTGIGEWDQVGSDGFGFTYLNFHFDHTGKLANTVKVRAAGTFSSSHLSGRATESTLAPNGSKLSPDRRFTFTGKRSRWRLPDGRDRFEGRPLASFNRTSSWSRSSVGGFPERSFGCPYREPSAHTAGIGIVGAASGPRSTSGSHGLSAGCVSVRSL